MISDDFALELRPILSAQRDLLARLRAQVDRETAALEVSGQHAADIGALDNLMAEVEAGAAGLPPDALVDFDPDEIPRLYERRQSFAQNELVRIGYTDWPSFVRHCASYDVTHGLDPMQPYEAFLDADDVALLKREDYREQYRWDKWDWTAVGISAILAAVADCLLVGTPRTSPLTRWLTDYSTSRDAKVLRDDWFARLARDFEDPTVPYDAQAAVLGATVDRIPGMGGRTHRFQSLGHDPILGFVFGVWDILQGTVTGFAYDRRLHYHRFVSGDVWANLEPIGVIEAFLRQFRHLISDVATSRGLPAPLLPLAQAFNVGHFGRKKRTLGEVARSMYENGYDFRHFLVGGLAPGLIEALLRAFIMIRQYIEYGEMKITIANHPKHRLMLLTAHAMASVANAGKVAVLQTPLAINEAQWLAFGRYLLPTLKYWLFDRDRLKLEHIEKINEAGWADLESASASLIERVARQLPSVDLGDLAPSAP